ncbi:MAG: hypothetical protein HIU86_11070 [Acidobacteria bacterium]|nr:hypothetical protein [Acidobacteriota bacterium]
MSTIIDVLITRNPLLAHGPRTHASGIQLTKDAPTRARRRPVRRDIDAPRIHLGREHRAA